MSITTVLFDLDGTLLPMDNDLFTKAYFKLLVSRIAPLGYDPKTLTDTIWKGTAAMVRNDGKETNEQVFWKVFASVYPGKMETDKPYFDDFYVTDFQKAKEACGYDPKAKETVYALKEKGYRTVLATNPIFPSYATQSRVRWTGMQPEDFELITTYENISFCKPNPAYYAEILKRQNLNPQECIMVGNDVDEDMIASSLGINVFLLTDNLINRQNRDISAYPHGGFDELPTYISTL